MSRREWSLLIALLLVNYIIFNRLISVIFTGGEPPPPPTNTPYPTFTPMPVVMVQPTTITPAYQEPTPTNTPVLRTPEPIPAPSLAPTYTPEPGTGFPVTANISLNIRSGPGVNYPIIGTFAQGASAKVVGRNQDSSWWQIEHQGMVGWVSAKYTSTGDGSAVPVASAPAAPTAAPAPTQAPTAAPSDGGGDGGGGGETLTGVQACFAQGYQFCPDAWYAGEPNEAMVQFRGMLKDYRTGGAVSGWHLLVRCGDYESLSFPTGPSSANPDYPPGKIDWMKMPAIYCDWNVAIVRYECPHYFNAECKEYTILSPVVPVRTDPGKGETIVVMDWLCNSEKFDCNGPSTGR